MWECQHCQTENDSREENCSYCGNLRSGSPSKKVLACPSCHSMRIGVDSANPGAFVLGILLFLVATLTASLASSLFAFFFGLASLVLAYAIICRFMNMNVWCQDCGTRFRRLD